MQKKIYFRKTADPENGGKIEQDERMERSESDCSLGGQKSVWGGLRRIDSLNLEAGRVANVQRHSTEDGWQRTLKLAFQSIGVVYGDIGTSPLYVYSSTFTNGIKETEDILGVLSLIIYTLLLVPMIKYVFVVLWANDNGDGGTFALYSLICRYAKVGLIPNEQAEDAMLSSYRLETPSSKMKRAQWIKQKLESSMSAKIALFLITILGTSMVLGDGVLTPCISVLSAIGGIKRSATSLNQDAIVGISVAILIVLFMIQRFGTDKIGYTFAPIILLWFLFIGGIGIFNLIKHDVSVLRAFNPQYIVKYFKRNGKRGWVSLGGVILCITGTEAMFADLGHFNVRAIQISFTAVLLPSVSLAYIGQAAYLVKFPDQVSDTFYSSIPSPIYWPTFVVAVAAAIIASQAMISGAFAIITQSLTLGCFPRVKVIHTSTKYEGQVYIPEINYILMIACVIVTVAFRTTAKIGNAYGIAVVSVMLITTFMVSLIMLMIWRTSIWWISLFCVIFGAIEVLYISAALYKFVEGGFLPLAFSLVLMSIMGAWHYVHQKRYMFELQNKVSSSYVRDLGQNTDLRRIPGIGLLYSELVQGIPPIFPHFIKNIPSIHSVLVFVSIKHLPINRVAMEERFLFRQLEPRDYRMFRCIVRYGYKDVHKEAKEFERQLVENLKEYIHHECFFPESGHVEQTIFFEQDEKNLTSDISETKDTEPSVNGASTLQTEDALQQINSPHASSNGIRCRSKNTSSRIANGPVQGAQEEKQFIQKAMDNGVVYLIGEAEVVAEQNSSLFKKAIVNYFYNFLRRNFRQGEKVMSIPQDRLLRVGMIYEI